MDTLVWLADRGGEEARAPIERGHYFYHWRPNRLIEEPKPSLKELQRRVLFLIVDHVPPHDAAHGFVAGRSVSSHAAIHCDRDLVMRVDLRSFFPSIRASRIHALFRTVGYPRGIARMLTALTTHRTPPSVFHALPRPSTADEARARYSSRQRHVTPHLPVGAPTSPALANLAAFRLDVRLSALAKSAGARYSRYADDLTFSANGMNRPAADRFFSLVCQIVHEEELAVQAKKTRFMRRSVRQRVTGVVVNAHPNPPRTEVDALRALLHNCARFGPESQNREGHPDFHAHLRGRIAWMSSLNSARGARLDALFARIRW